MPRTLECDQERYPYWYGRTDPRNRILHQKLSEFRRSIGITGNKECPFLFNLAYIPLSNTSFATIKTCDKNFL